MRIETVRKYASGKAPFLGIPVFSLTVGRYVTAVFRSEHLQAAASAPVTKAYYDEKEHVLVLNGTNHAEYRLKDLKNTPGTYFLGIREQILTWAERQKNRLHRQVHTPAERRIVKLETEVRKLTRELGRIYCHAPVGPMMPYKREIASAGWRENELRWREEKPLRRKVGWLAHSPRKTWKQFYDDVAAIIGRQIDTSYRHDRVCHRKNGPGIVDYLHQLPEHIKMARKGYSRGNPWDPWDDSYSEGNEFQRHRKAQMEYLTARRERETLQNIIDEHLAEIAELRAT